MKPLMPLYVIDPESLKDLFFLYRIKFFIFHHPMPSVYVVVYIINHMHDIGIETIEKMVIESTTKEKKNFSCSSLLHLTSK